jgi:hypothetical protein
MMAPRRGAQVAAGVGILRPRPRAQSKGAASRWAAGAQNEIAANAVSSIPARIADGAPVLVTTGRPLDVRFNRRIAAGPGACAFARISLVFMPRLHSRLYPAAMDPAGQGCRCPCHSMGADEPVWCSQCHSPSTTNAEFKLRCQMIPGREVWLIPYRQPGGNISSTMVATASS